MDVTGAARRTVFDWMAKYNRGGIDEWLDRPKSGRPTFLSEDQQRPLAAPVAAGPSQEDVVSVFNAATIDEWVEREFGVLYSLRGMQALLGRLGLSYPCPRPRHEKADPVAQEQFKNNSLRSRLKSLPTIPASESKSTSKTKRGSAGKGR